MKNNREELSLFSNDDIKYNIMRYLFDPVKRVVAQIECPAKMSFACMY